MMELLALMWSQLKHNTVLAFLAVILIAGSNSFVAYESSRTNVNIEAITKTMVAISERSEENSKLIAKTQQDMLELQEKLFNKDWEQDKVISGIYMELIERGPRIRSLEERAVK